MQMYVNGERDTTVPGIEHRINPFAGLLLQVMDENDFDDYDIFNMTIKVFH